MICKNCGKEIANPKLNFCAECGAIIENTSKAEAVPEWKKYQEESINTDTPAPTKSTPGVAASAIKVPPQTQPLSRQTSTFSATASDEMSVKEMTRSAIGKISDGIDRIIPGEKYTIPKKLTPDDIVPTEGEIPVKQYVFSKMKLPVIKYKAESVLQVTNKRIIYNLIGSSALGYERTHSEFSIDDVAGITVEKSSRMSLIIFWAYFILGIPLLAIAGGIFGIGGAAGKYISLILALSGAVGAFMLSKTKLNFVYHLVSAISCDLALIGYSSSGGRSMFGMGMSLGSYGYGSSGTMQVLDTVLKFVFGLAFLFLLFNNIMSYIKSMIKPTISVIVTSKSGSAEPINCTQTASTSVATNSVKALCDTLPTEETQTMMRELGAMVSDIQKMGDFAVEKWRKK